MNVKKSTHKINRTHSEEEESAGEEGRWRERERATKRTERKKSEIDKHRIAGRQCICISFKFIIHVDTVAYAVDRMKTNSKKKKIGAKSIWKIATV